MAVAVPWRAETVDTVKTGGPDTPVTGIATTFMSTLGVLQRAAAQVINKISLSPGYASLPGSIRAINNADVSIIGEARE